MPFSQNQRSLQFSSAALQEGQFLLTEIEGHETLSKPYRYQIKGLSSIANYEAEKLFGKAVTITLEAHTQNPQNLHGFITKLALAESDKRGWFAYEMELSSPVLFLKFASNSRRFEKKTIIDILFELCQSIGLKLDISQIQKEAFPILNYVAQYQETHFDFFHRLLQEAHLHYYFEHDAQETKIILKDKFYQSSETRHLNYSDFNNWKHDYSLLLVNSEKQIVQGSSQETQLEVGRFFKLSNHFDATENQAYLVTHVKYKAHDYSQLTEIESKRETQAYANFFQAVPYNSIFKASIPWQEKNHPTRQPELAPHHDTETATPTLKGNLDRSIIDGTQTAQVYGEFEKQINADSLGRLKVTYFWQHDDDLKQSTHSIPVTQGVAGKNWGTQWLPRYGDEVIVRFFFGDPNQPIIIGSLYNGLKQPYYSLPANKNKNGWITKSVNNTNIIHQIIFDDTAHQEKFLISSGKNFNLKTTKKWQAHIHQNCQYSVQKDFKLELENFTLQAAKEIHLNTGSSIDFTPTRLHFGAQQIHLGESGSADNPKLALMNAGIPYNNIDEEFEHFYEFKDEQGNAVNLEYKILHDEEVLHEGTLATGCTPSMSMDKNIKAVFWQPSNPKEKSESTSKHCENHKPIKVYTNNPSMVIIEYNDGCKEIRKGGSRAWRNNNPGNISKGQLASKFGGIGVNNRFAIFPNKKTGFKAIILLLNTPIYQATSLFGSIKIYAPSNENDTTAYADFVSKKTGIPKTQAINTLSQAQIENIADAIEQYEGWKPGELILEEAKC